jgi:hypothetical protein
MHYAWRRRRTTANRCDLVGVGMAGGGEMGIAMVTLCEIAPFGEQSSTQVRNRHGSKRVTRCWYL